jgi:membrane-associated HD superfamily phosphohydrolase
MTPSLSAVVLTAHVREGLDIAGREHLPPAIKDIIEQHHGTSLIKYFYQRASSGNAEGVRCPLEQRFRYPGPKPQTKEAAIVMLADSVEAASHSLARPTPSRIEELVDTITENLIADGQFDESTLLIRDLTAIKSSCIHLLSGILHRRIEYPTSSQRAVEQPALLRYSGSGHHDSDLLAKMPQSLPTENENTSSTRKFAEQPSEAVVPPAPLSVSTGRRKPV